MTAHDPHEGFIWGSVKILKLMMMVAAQIYVFIKSHSTVQENDDKILRILSDQTLRHEIKSSQNSE